LDGNFLFKVVIFFANKKATYYGVPGFRGPYPSIAIATATPPLHAGLTPAQKKSIHGFFLGLQNRVAILHAANPPSMAR
jgi:hypothetical protein